ncbi:MAG: SRPBCC domain-containing protein [Gammaproteobacteria bacterium]|nr:SRPBCC domain-containing protein [Gammaproteobacteria bacterium]MDH3467861.1 SRPBCC domain-containing protein [Gammaproteobacteria bacterium]
MASIRHEVWIDAPPSRVFELLSSAEGISTWWDQQTKVDTPEGVVLEHNPGPEHGTVQFLVLESEKDRLVRWRCISSHPENVPASEWTGTEISFHMGERSSSEPASEKWSAQIPVQTVLRLDHSGWPDNSKYLPFCNFAWADVLTKLSKKAMENGD